MAAEKAIGIVAEKSRGVFKGRWFWTQPSEETTRAWGDTQLVSSSSLVSSTPGRHEGAEETKIPAPAPSGTFDTPDCPACAMFGEWPTGCPHTDPVEVDW